MFGDLRRHKRFLGAALFGILIGALLWHWPMTDRILPSALRDSLQLDLADQVATLRLNRPQLHNAFDDGLIDALTGCLQRLGADADIRAVVLAGNGVQFLGPPTTPAGGGEVRAFARDPDGHLLELHTGTLDERLARYARGREGVT